MILSRSIAGDADFQWQDLAACKGMAQKRRPGETEAVDFFFDTFETDPGVRDGVRELCASCPVRQNCLEYGITNRLSGVWGGEYLVDGQIQG